MNKTNVLFAVVVVILAGLAGFWGYELAKGPGQAAPDHGNLTWSFAETAPGDPDSGAGPQTKVTLTAEGTGRTYDAGTHTGSCSVIESSAWELLDGEKTGVICWWAGGGTEIGVFEENGKLVVKSGDVEEGTAETAGMRGNFSLLFPLD